ncbi:MAG: TIR domain-containing protein [Scytonema sp. RU_4_4]|nr:TIR domain-containing protein [Scytonema sp. RU_4_4]
MSNELTPVQSSQSVEVFVSYSHKDENLLKRLEAHLSILKRQGVISLWHDRKITPGREWANEIDSNLNTADIILLLVSVNFFESDYCYGIELKRALERHEAGVARVIPIIIRPVDWQNAPFAKLNALPKDGKPVTTWRNRDEAFVDVARGIREAATELTTNDRAKATRPSTVSGNSKGEDITPIKQEQLQREIQDINNKLNQISQELDRIRSTSVVREDSQKEEELEGQKANLEEKLKDLEDVVQYMRLHQKVLEWLDGDRVKLLAEETVKEVFTEHPEWENLEEKVGSPEKIKQFRYDIEDYLRWLRRSTTVYQPLPLEQIDITPTLNRDVYLEAFKVIQKKASRELSPDEVGALEIYTSYLIEHFTSSD